MKLYFALVLLFGAVACTSPNNSSTSPAKPADESLTPQSVTASSEALGPNSPAKPAPLIAPSKSPTQPTQVPATNGVGIVWNGAGACPDGCALAGEKAVVAAGLTVRYVNENTPASSLSDLNSIFKNAKVWIMPGGYASQEVEAMTPELIKSLRSFISSGGGYIGWCAGAFAATQSIGTIGKPGLNIFPGSEGVYSSSNKQNNYGASIEKTTWFNDTRQMYLEGGPYFKDLPSSVEVVSRFDDQTSVAAARTSFGNGRVYLTSTHPEAPTWWWSGTGVDDTDGSDEALAVDMVKWAAQL
jgi:glutamine amidotransferase-like uncharacterized protein